MSLSIKHAPLSDNPEALNLGPYMCVADANLRVISIFDDLKYDRADVDMMSPAMRNHAIARLDPLGFKQVSGTVLKHHASGVCCFIPKVYALGASPFDGAPRTTAHPDGDFGRRARR